MPSEKEIHAWLEKQIKNGAFHASIYGRDRVASVTGSMKDPLKSPSFTIDHVVRQQIALAAEEVLAGLQTVEIISSDKNVSSTTNQSLRPDLLLFNKESRCLIILEIKKDKQTARETVTELLAYEQEVKNYLPFASDLDVTFIVVAGEWSTLLSHSVASAVTWGAKKILALSLTSDDSGFRLETFFPSAWASLASINLPKGALPVATLRLLPKNSSDAINLDTFQKRLHTAIELIARSGDRAGAHGFAILWADTDTHSANLWNITIACVNPYAFLDAAITKGSISSDGTFAEFFLKDVENNFACKPSKSMYKLAENAVNYLSNWYDALWSREYEWKDQRAVMAPRAVLSHFEFWGLLGEHARTYTTSPAVHSLLLPVIGRQGLDWRDPIIALSILDELTGKRPIPDGVLTARSCYDLGVIFGAWLQVDEQRFRTIHEVDLVFECLLEWVNARLLVAYSEICATFRAYDDITIEPPPLYISSEKRTSKPRESFDSIVNWVRERLIGHDNKLHYASFDLGYFSGAQSDDSLEQLFGSDGVTNSSALIANTMIAAAAAYLLDTMRGRTLTEREQLALDDMKRCLGDNFVDRLKKGIKVIEIGTPLSSFINALLEFVDALIPPVFHSIAPIDTFSADWEWFKLGVKEMCEKGETHPCVILTPDGTLGTGRPPAAYSKMMAPIRNPEDEVYFWNRMPGLESFTIVKWDQLAAGAVPGLKINKAKVT